MSYMNIQELYDLQNYQEAIQIYREMCSEELIMNQEIQLDNDYLEVGTIKVDESEK